MCAFSDHRHPPTAAAGIPTRMARASNAAIATCLLCCSVCCGYAQYWYGEEEPNNKEEWTPPATDPLVASERYCRLLLPGTMKQPPRPDHSGFAKLSADELVPYVMSQKTLPGVSSYGQKEHALDWFLFRTWNSPKDRAKLADRIVHMVATGNDVHDFLDEAEYLGRLRAHYQICKLLHFRTNLICCFYQSLLQGLTEYTNAADIPILIPLLKHESGGSSWMMSDWGDTGGGTIAAALETLHKLYPTDGKKPPGEEAAWREWWKKNAKTVLDKGIQSLPKNKPGSDSTPQAAPEEPAAAESEQPR